MSRTDICVEIVQRTGKLFISVRPCASRKALFFFFLYGELYFRRTYLGGGAAGSSVGKGHRCVSQESLNKHCTYIKKISLYWHLGNEVETDLAPCFRPMHPGYVYKKLPRSWLQALILAGLAELLPVAISLAVQEMDPRVLEVTTFWMLSNKTMKSWLYHP